MPTVAVIGSGPSGLAAAKSFVEAGIEPVVFDSAPDIGGMWGAPGRGAWSSYARTNLSKFSCTFSDYSWPQRTDIFPMRRTVIDYLRGYVEEFRLQRYLRLSTTVEGVEAAGPHLWNVTTVHEGVRETRAFDWVVVASGVFSRPFVPEFDGLPAFQGKIYHAADCYSEEVNRENFAGKKVLIIGAAFSGTEIAGQIVDFATEVTVGLRNPMWFVPRWVKPWPDAPLFPADLVFYTREPGNPLMTRPRAYLRELGGDPGTVCPDLAFDNINTAAMTVVTSDDFLALVGASRIKVKRSKAFAFDDKGVIYSDGTRADLDAVVMCTGYSSSLPFLSQDILDTIEFDPRDQLQPVLLHHQVFHPKLPGLAFVGYYRGPYFPIMELQGRWVAGIASGEIPPPTLAEMQKGVDIERAIRNRRPRPQFPHGDYVRLADGFAREIGVFPEGPEVADVVARLQEGPLVASNFRLVGPHARPQLARTMMLSTPAPLLDANS
jgi:dimethylaniline monooxygenase (N-oxide forming)